MSLKKIIRKFILENTQNVDQFISKILEKYPKSKSFIGQIQKEIESSGCQKIEFATITNGALGVALHNAVIISNTALTRDLGFFIFVLFHELAHQYQFRKYGADVMYAFYLGKIEGKEAAKFLKYTEVVADEFATRKFREFQRKGFLDKNLSPNLGFYKNVPEERILDMLDLYREKISNFNLKTVDEVTEWFYNTLKLEI